MNSLCKYHCQMKKNVEGHLYKTIRCLRNKSNKINTRKQSPSLSVPKHFDMNSVIPSSVDIMNKSTETIPLNKSTEKIPLPIEKTWSWIPPRESDGDSDRIKTIPGQLLTSNEVIEALDVLGAENIVSIPLIPKLDTISEFIIASGRSLKHMKKMSDTLVQALKRRNLRKAPGYTGAEGGDTDEWVVVDCYNLAVHLMLPRTRQAINLEDHWKSNDRPVVNYSTKESVYEKQFEELLEKYPPPSEDLHEKDIEKKKEIKIHVKQQNIPRL